MLDHTVHTEVERKSVFFVLLFLSCFLKKQLVIAVV